MANSPQYNYQNYGYPKQISPNAVNINIISPAAYGSIPQGTCSAANQNGYSLYGTSPNNGMYYPSNYNNMFVTSPYNASNPMASNGGLNPYMTQVMPQMVQNQYPNAMNPSQNGSNAQMYDYNQGNPQNPQINPSDGANSLNPQGTNAAANVSYIEKTPQEAKETSQNDETSNSDEAKKSDKKKDEKKKIVPLTDDYIKSLENYLNDSNPKVRLIAAKDILARFKEDENRKDNKSLIPLLNKMLRDTSPSVKFLGLETLDLGYCVGDNETVEILKQIQKGDTDKSGQNQLMASQILLKMTSPDRIEKE